jgi:CrcB protein
LVVNATGSFLLGLVSELARGGTLGRASATAIGTGFIGGYTTYSTFNYETLQLLEGRALLLAGWNVLGTVLVCAGMGVGGIWVARLAGH